METKLFVDFFKILSFNKSDKSQNIKKITLKNGKDFSEVIFTQLNKIKKAKFFVTKNKIKFEAFIYILKNNDFLF